MESERSIAILIPTLGRGDRLAAIVANIEQTTPEPHHVYFIAESHDVDSLSKALHSTARLIINDHKPNYAGAINCAYERTKEPFLFAAADDLVFHPGWATAAMAEFDVPAIQVVGTNDLGNSYVLAGQHATHYLVKRSYLDEIGGDGDFDHTFLPEIYDHNYTDTHFIAVAQKRSVFAPCLSSVVEHFHPAFGKAKMDATYERGNREYNVDRERFLSEMKRLGVDGWHA